MAISGRQAAAIARRKRDARVDRELAEERARLGLVMPTSADQVPDDPDLVGWFYKSVTSVKGTGHVCITCRPYGGLGPYPVYRHMLAATQDCTMCGTRLETIHRQKVTGEEKK